MRKLRLQYKQEVSSEVTIFIDGILLKEFRRTVISFLICYLFVLEFFGQVVLEPAKRNWYSL